MIIYTNNKHLDFTTATGATIFPMGKGKWEEFSKTIGSMKVISTKVCFMATAWFASTDARSMKESLGITSWWAFSSKRNRFPTQECFNLPHKPKRSSNSTRNRKMSKIKEAFKWDNIGGLLELEGAITVVK